MCCGLIYLSLRRRKIAEISVTIREIERAAKHALSKTGMRSSTRTMTTAGRLCHLSFTIWIRKSDLARLLIAYSAE